MPRRSSVVLGGGGFIGVNLCRTLAARGETVRAFGRRNPFGQAADDWEWFQGDFRDPTSVSAAVEGAETVYHLVNATTPQSANLHMVAEVEQNLIPTLNLLDICAKVGVKTLIFVSSGGTVYGRTSASPTPESAPTDPMTAYGITKLSIERYLSLHNKLHGLNYRIARLSNPYGPFQTAAKNQGVIASFIAHALHGETLEIWGDGSVIRDYVFIDDVVDALVRLDGYEGEHRMFNVGTGVGRSLNEVIAELEVVIGRPLPVERRGARMVDVPVSILSIERARQHLGWAPKTTFRSGLQQTLAWYSDYRAGRH